MAALFAIPGEIVTLLSPPQDHDRLGGKRLERREYFVFL